MGARARARGVALLLVVTGVTAGGWAGASPAAAGEVARFEGRPIDLRDGWGAARACAVQPAGTTCFRSGRAMDRFLATSATTGRTTSASCSTALRLYDGTGYSSQSLALTTRGVYINLGDYGFSARTSSYKVGVCSSHFNDGTYGSGAGYPGNTAANAQASSMLTGWNNRVRSVYIY